MRRFIATIRVEVEAQSDEARDDVLARLCDRLNKNPPSVLYDDKGLGAVRSNVKVSRIRPARKRTR